MRKPYQCRICKDTGHNAKACPRKNELPIPPYRESIRRDAHEVFETMLGVFQSSGVDAAMHYLLGATADKPEVMKRVIFESGRRAEEPEVMVLRAAMKARLS